MLLTLIFFAATPFDWHGVGDIDGVGVEVRRVASSDFEQLRLTAKSSRSVDSLCRIVWGVGDLKTAEPGFKVRRVLHQTENERWTYEHIELPIISDRDYTVHAKRMSEPGLCQVNFEARNGDGPAPQPGLVRIEHLVGAWSIEPDDGGGSVVTYIVQCDPGGSLPAWMTRGPQRRNAVGWVKTILARSDPLEAQAKAAAP